MDREYNMSEHCPNSVRTAREAVCDVRTLSNSVRTLPNKDKLFEQCSNSTPLHGGLFEHCSNAWKGSITCPNTVRTVFKQHAKQCVMSEHFQTVFGHCQTRTNCLNSVRTAHHCTAGCLNTVQTHGKGV